MHTKQYASSLHLCREWNGFIKSCFIHKGTKHMWFVFLLLSPLDIVRRLHYAQEHIRQIATLDPFNFIKQCSCASIPNETDFAWFQGAQFKASTCLQSVCTVATGSSIGCVSQLIGTNLRTGPLHFTSCDMSTLPIKLSAYRSHLFWLQAIGTALDFHRSEATW